jgi:predicted TIM-barrel fold metal-dependent hydrolase
MPDQPDHAKSTESIYRGLAMPYQRVAQDRSARELPEGTVVVSADNHWSLTDDIFVERFPAELRDRAPRLYQDERGNYQWHADGKSVLAETQLRLFSGFERLPGAVSLAPRLKDLDAEGIDMEIVFGNAIGAFHRYPDLEVRGWVYRVYNQHLAEMAERAPGRFYGVGLVNYWDPDKMQSSMDELISLGLKTFQLPIMPAGANGAAMSYADPALEPFWQIVEDAGLPVCFHVGEFFQGGPGGAGISIMVNFGPFRRNFAELMVGGVFDRHPNLRVVFAEADINWIPGAIQTAEMVFDSYGDLLEPRPKHEPAHYWHTHCYATFMHDPIGLGMLDTIGADRVMWSADYPHMESTFGATWSAYDAVRKYVSDADTRLILGGTATQVFGLS